jgi:hypothetical protein
MRHKRLETALSFLEGLKINTGIHLQPLPALALTLLGRREGCLFQVMALDHWGEATSTIVSRKLDWSRAKLPWDPPLQHRVCLNACLKQKQGWIGTYHKEKFPSSTHITKKSSLVQHITKKDSLVQHITKKCSFFPTLQFWNLMGSSGFDDLLLANEHAVHVAEHWRNEI